MADTLLTDALMALPWLSAEDAAAAFVANRQAIAQRLLWTGQAVTTRGRMEG